MFGLDFPFVSPRHPRAPLSAGSHREPDGPGSGPRAPKNVHTNTAETKGILWIDDEIEPEDPLIQLLASHGFRVDVARTAAEGQSRAEAGRYDGIIIDLHLPDFFGLTLLRRLRASGITTPVLVATAYYLEPEMEPYAIEAGATVFAQKPILDAAELGRLLDSMLTSTRRAPGSGETPAASLASSLGIVAASAEMRRIIERVERLDRVICPCSSPAKRVPGKSSSRECAIHRGELRRDS